VRIAKPLLLTTTALGLPVGIYEAWHLAGGLVLLPGLMVLVLGAAFAGLIATIHREGSTANARKP
jgi:hypothetical protein